MSQKQPLFLQRRAEATLPNIGAVAYAYHLYVGVTQKREMNVNHSNN